MGILASIANQHCHIKRKKSMGAGKGSRFWEKKIVDTSGGWSKITKYHSGNQCSVEQRETKMATIKIGIIWKKKNTNYSINRAKDSTILSAVAIKIKSYTFAVRIAIQFETQCSESRMGEGKSSTDP